ncbi:hypothetical protein JJE66_03940 [Bradyrhizobium diazoefficiens]|nr:hypothetical protein [Bradyrhizobium diazoefficiens]MBK3660402.1 hypothetical protein [Bradyrhizobium diazoefficiens]
MHVAFGKITAAGVERQPSGRRDEVLEPKEFIRLVRVEEAMIGQGHRHATSEILVGLHHADIGGAKTSHAVKVRRYRLEAGTGIER